MKASTSSKQVADIQDWIQVKHQEIQAHSSWFGAITGVSSESALRNLAPFTYLLRSGEEAGHYYLSFVQEDGTFKHQPFVVEMSLNGWFYRNGNPHISTTLDGIIPMIMHCDASVCMPLVKRFDS